MKSKVKHNLLTKSHLVIWIILYFFVFTTVSLKADWYIKSLYTVFYLLNYFVSFYFICDNLYPKYFEANKLKWFFGMILDNLKFVLWDIILTRKILVYIPNVNYIRINSPFIEFIQNTLLFSTKIKH